MKSQHTGSDARVFRTACLSTVFALAALGASVPGPAAAEPADPTGVWLVKDGDARVQIERCPQPRSKICGYIVWTKDAAGTDDKNPEAGRRGRSVLGMQMLLGLEPDGNVYSGPIYNAENGKTYDAHIKLEDATHLTLKGCVLKYLCQSQVWTKVADITDGQITGKIDGPGGPRTDAEWAAAATKTKAARVSKH